MTRTQRQIRAILIAICFGAIMLNITNYMIKTALKPYTEELTQLSIKVDKNEIFSLETDLKLFKSIDEEYAPLAEKFEEIY